MAHIELELKDKIYTIRGKQVILDEHLAQLYEVQTKVLNQTVMRNKERFSEQYMFTMTQDEFNSIRSQFVTLEKGRGKFRKYIPNAFTEHGVAMLAGLLRSKTAIRISIKIIDEFVNMRHFLKENASIFQRLDRVELKQLEHDSKFNQIFQAIERKQLTPNQGIFFDGQIYDAYKFITDLIKKAKQQLILIDNYIDETTLQILSHKQAKVKVTIYTSEITEQLQLASTKFNEQYKYLQLKKFTKSHDRFLIIDKQTYHIGASLKDAGKKWFAFSKMQHSAVLENLAVMLK